MEIAVIIGRNIDNLRNSHNVSLEQLAELINVTRQTMSNYIKGKQIIDSGKLAVLARYFNKPLEYFLAEEHNELSFMFRADNPKENFNDILSSKINRKISTVLEILAMSERKLAMVPESYNLKTAGKKLNLEEKEIIEEIALKKREEFGISDIIPENIYKVFQEKDINLLACPFHNDKIFAVSAYSPEHGSFIVLNNDENIPEERKIFSAVHELGHLIFHRNQYTGDISCLFYGRQKDINEEIANHFAMCFLVPRNIIKRYKKSYKEKPFFLSEVLEHKRHLRVSAMCLIYALHYYGIISKDQKGIHIGYLKKKGYAQAEPRPIAPINKDSYWIELIKDLYLRDKITVNKICEVLEIPLLQARKMVKEWVIENERTPETVL